VGVSVRSISVDDKEEIKKAILCRFYDGAFKDGVDYQVGLRAYAEEKGIGWELINEIYDELNDEGFFGICCTSMVVQPSVKALIHCETHQLVDPALVEKQNDIRKRILEACVDIHDEKLTPYAYGGIDSDMICERANISLQDFTNNAGILAYCDYIERQHPLHIWRITEKGKELVKDLRRKRAHLKEFEKLGDLIDMTRQARGLKFQKLLAEVIEDEGWKVKEGARPQGKENDIVITKDLINYFLVSCKWEAEPIQVAVVEHLRSRAQGMVFSTGILVSMSGFTPNCMDEVLQGRTLKEIVLFGPEDIGAVFLNEKTFTDLLYEKIERLKHVGRVLVDGIEN
jgi:predicted transcriptional regulator